MICPYCLFLALVPPPIQQNRRAVLPPSLVRDRWILSDQLPAWPFLARRLSALVTHLPHEPLGCRVPVPSLDDHIIFQLWLERSTLDSATLVEKGFREELRD